MSPRKLIETTLVSLDGIVESPWEWVGPYFGDESKRHSLGELEQADTFLMGRVTFEKLVARWPGIKDDPYFDHINRMPKLVASTTLREPGWNTRVIDGEVSTTLAALKRQSGKNIIKYGSGQLTRTLIDENLIDEFHFGLVPVLLGKGRRLFEGVDTTRLSLKLTRTETLDGGVVWLTYVRTYD
jgi:dihydrofolate reductase